MEFIIIELIRIESLFNKALIKLLKGFIKHLGRVSFLIKLSKAQQGCFYMNFVKFFTFHFRGVGYFQTRQGFLNSLSFIPSDITNFLIAGSFYFLNLENCFLKYKKVAKISTTDA